LCKPLSEKKKKREIGLTTTTFSCYKRKPDTVGGKKETLEFRKKEDAKAIPRASRTKNLKKKGSTG